MIKNVLFSTVAVVALAGLVVSPSVSAQENEKKIEICHRNDNAKQPYGPKRIEVDQSAADGLAPGNGDHFMEHVGPIASTQAEAEQMKKDKLEWGDIIPAIPGVHDGLNWDDEGKAVWNNDCQFVTPGQGTTPEQPEKPVVPVTPGSGDVTPVTPAVVDVLPTTSGDRTLAYTLIAAGLATIVTGIVVGFNSLYRRSA